MSVSVQACKVKKDTGSQTWTRPIQASTQYHPVGNAYQLPPPPPESKQGAPGVAPEARER